MTVRDNIAFGLQIAKKPKAEIDREVGFDAPPHPVGGPGRQEAGSPVRRPAPAGGRRPALINKPGVLLLDEPLAALDLKLRQRMLIELDMIHDQVGITFLYVTHDQSEAMSLSDRIAVMNAGRIEQIGAPAEIYEAPRTSFVAAFIGDTNFLEGVVADHPEPEYSRLRIEGLPDVTVYNDKQIADGHKIFLSIRPEKIQISRDRPEPKPKRNAVPAVVEDVIYLGPTTKYWVRAGEHRLQVLRQHARFSRREADPLEGRCLGVLARRRRIHARGLPAGR